MNFGGVQMDNLGMRLKLSRERADLTQIDVYKAINLNNKSLSRYENNISSPDPDTIRALAKLYNVTTDYLFGLAEPAELVNEQKLSPAENKLLHIFRSLSPIGQGRLLERAEIIRDSDSFSSASEESLHMAK